MNTETVTKAIGGVVSVVKGLIVVFIFANIIYQTPLNPIEGIKTLVDSFLFGGLTGLLTLLVFVSLYDGK